MISEGEGEDEGEGMEEGRGGIRSVTASLYAPWMSSKMTVY